MKTELKEDLRDLYEIVNSIDYAAYYVVERPDSSTWQDIDTIELQLNEALLKIKGIQLKHHNKNCKECKCHE